MPETDKHEYAVTVHIEFGLDFDVATIADEALRRIGARMNVSDIADESRWRIVEKPGVRVIADVRDLGVWADSDSAAASAAEKLCANAICDCGYQYYRVLAMKVQCG